MLICRFCNKDFERKCNLSRHEKRCILNPNRINEVIFCPECGLKCNNKQILKQHLLMTHSDESENRKRKCAKAYKVNKNIITIYDLSSRTRGKVLERMKIGCSRCGWNESSCDLHHIIPKSKGGSNNHSNLTYLCPNCHRLAHNNKI